MSQPSNGLRQVLFRTARSLGSLRATRDERHRKDEYRQDAHAADCTGSSGPCQGEAGSVVREPSADTTNGLNARSEMANERAGGPTRAEWGSWGPASERVGESEGRSPSE